MKRDDMTKCKKKGPYFPVGDTEWVCTVHETELRLIDDLGPIAKSNMYCPIGEYLVALPKDEYNNWECYIMCDFPVTGRHSPKCRGVN